MRQSGCRGSHRKNLDGSSLALELHLAQRLRRHTAVQRSVVWRHRSGSPRPATFVCASSRAARFTVSPMHV